ncbi:MAG: SoxR reducing system RseC family protein [Tannerella sp.]|nr:SoxR reducing system RseC family protein [Tannerella sp.]
MIERTEPSVVYVRIIQQPACSGCHAKSLCPVSEHGEKIIEIEDRSGNFSVNEKVNIHVRLSQGMTAVLIAFVIPLALTVTALATAQAISGNELIAAAAGLCILIPYGAAIRLMRGKLKKKFAFTLSKII